MPFQEVQFFAADGVSLTGWYIPQSYQGKPSRRTIVCCHPYNSSKSNLLGVARGFWDQRYSLFLFDFRSFAHIRTEQSIGFLEQRDARAAIATAKHLSPEGTQIGVMGASMGGAVALIVGHEEETAAVGIAADCAFSSLSAVLEQAIHHRFPYLPSILTCGICKLSALMNPAVCWLRGITPYSFDEVSPVSAVRSGPRAGDVPLLLIHAEDDQTCPISHAHAIHAAAAVDDKDLVVVQRCQHVGCFFQDRLAYMKLVVGFFDRVFERAEEEAHLLVKSRVEEREDLDDGANGLGEGWGKTVVDASSGFVKVTGR